MQASGKQQPQRNIKKAIQEEERTNSPSGLGEYNGESSIPREDFANSGNSNDYQ
jgi:hypothetical protein